MNPVLDLLRVAHEAGYAFVKAAKKDPTRSYGLVGRLYKSQSGWILLNVPNALVRGAFDALDEPGAELPPHKDKNLNGHISVIRPEELEQIDGGADAITERGHMFHYTLGPVKTVEPAGWSEMSKVWYIEVASPELKALRKSYGLTPLPNENKHQFHITIAVRRRNVLRDNGVSKAAENMIPEEIVESDEPAFDMVCSSCELQIEKCGCHGGIVLVKAGRSAKGIPDRSYYGDPTKVPINQLVEFVLARHLAQRAGPHFDFRFGGPAGLHSFAHRKPLPGPGGRIAAHQQPMHSFRQLDWEGAIPSGQYGAGHVKKQRRGQLLFTKVSPGAVHFTTADKKHPERFVLVKPDKWGERDWLLVNTTPTDPLPYDKVRYRRLPADQVESALANMQAGETFETKVDGASGLLKLLKDGVELVSYRRAKETGRPIIHTERFFHGAGSAEIPKHLAGSVLKGELYGVQSSPVNAPRTDGQSVRLVSGNGNIRANTDSSTEDGVSGRGDESTSQTGAGFRRTPTSLPVVVQNEEPLQEPAGPELSQPWRQGKSDTPKLAAEFREFLQGHGGLSFADDAGEEGFQRALRAVELLLGHQEGAGEKQADDSAHNISRHKTVSQGLGEKTEDVTDYPGQQTQSRTDSKTGIDRASEQKEPSTDRVIGAQELGGILNAALAKSIRDQKARGINLKMMVYDIQQRGSEHIDWEQVPRAERRKMIEEILQYLPQDRFHISPAATSPEEAQKLWEEIQSGRNPLSSEGAVFWPNKGVPWKSKLLEESDVHIRDVFPGEGRLAGRGIGGFEYSLEPGGKAVGRVGTGLSDDLRRSAYLNPQDYIGRVARIRAQQQYPSGAYRAPAFLALHEDEPRAKAASVLARHEGLTLEELNDLGMCKDADHVPTVAVDLDGTLAKHYTKYDPGSIPEPRPNAKKKMEEFKEEGYCIIINTVRGDKELIKNWLEEHEIPYDYINENPDQPEGSSGKIMADVYIDDRAIDGTQSWTAIHRLADKQLSKAANRFFLGEALKTTPIYYNRNRSLLQNLGNYLGSVATNAQNRIGQAYTGRRFETAFDPQARIEDLIQQLRGNDTIVTNPYDKALTLLGPHLPQ